MKLIFPLGDNFIGLALLLYVNTEVEIMCRFYVLNEYISIHS